MTILIHRDDAVRVVTLNRPEKRNALSKEMLLELRETFAEPPEPSERAVVIRAAGTVFSAGLDLREQADGEQGVDTTYVEQALRAIAAYPLPTIAVVQGDAIGGGVEVAFHCDLVLATEAAQFTMPLTRIGLVPSWYLTKRVVETLQPALVRALFLGTQPLSGRDLHRAGAIYKAVDGSEVEAELAKLVASITLNDAKAMRVLKATIDRLLCVRDQLPRQDIDDLIESVLSDNGRATLAADAATSREGSSRKT